MQTKLFVIKDQFLSFLLRFQDVKFAGSMVFVVIVLLISWSGVKSIQTNYELQRQIVALQQQNSLKKLDNDNLALENQYYNTDSYLDITARQNFGLAAPGEREVVIPKTAALGYTVELPKPKQEDQKPATARQPNWQRNFEAWVNFFLHRQTNE